MLSALAAVLIWLFRRKTVGPSVFVTLLAGLVTAAFGYARRTWPITMPHLRPIDEML